MKMQDTPNHHFLHVLQSHRIASSLAEHLICRGKISSHRIRNLQQSSQLVPVFQAIAQHIHKPISIDDLCRWAHLSPSRLHAVFLETTGMAPIRYVLQARLTRARQQLIYTDMPISQIAQSLAFASPFHFSRVFREAVGMSPSTYRTQNNLAYGM
jgi:AraC-like DNA-binding protein